MKLHQIINEFFEAGRVKYYAGQRYVPTEETTRMVAQGAAWEVDGDEATAWQPGAHPVDTEARKAELRRLIAAADVTALKAELDELEKNSPTPPAPPVVVDVPAVTAELEELEDEPVSTPAIEARKTQLRAQLASVPKKPTEPPLPVTPRTPEQASADQQELTTLEAGPATPAGEARKAQLRAQLAAVPKP